ncbi:hypothetical protein CAEBREN_20603 [Caenorhabditis brenneri]|uniref:Uncharacterized protein n=1 Tax=Caenorhabditis brenneri TaxID=135651 RepID=G0MDB3_CAEBE|nr:hypothetical protein CAEBREN_20603 [Caenorhabditis brenneri]
MLPATPTWEAQNPPNPGANEGFYPIPHVWMDHVMQTTYTVPVAYGVPHSTVPISHYPPIGHVLQSPENYGIYSFLPTLNPYVAVPPIAHPQGFGGNYGVTSPYQHDPLYNWGQHIPTPPTPLASAPRQSSRKPKASKLKIQKKKCRKIKAEPKTSEALYGKIKKEVE